MFSAQSCTGTVHDLNNVPERLTSQYVDSSQLALSDSFLEKGWHRAVNGTHQFYLADNATELDYGHCGTYRPVYLSGKL